VRKYLFSGVLVSGVLGAIRLARRTAKGPRDARLALDAAAWALGTAVAIGSLRERSRRMADARRADETE